jgi:UDP-N-acetyl-D-mannosaminuronic acid dehydrogenase
LANHHPRVNILNPGPGVGGHCIAVDPWFIVDSAPELAKIIATARTVNDSKPQYVVDKIKAAAIGFDAPKVACLGLTFKADIDDLRESPALQIVEMLVKESMQLLLVEPYITSLPNGLIGSDNASLVSLEEALQRADIIVGLVDHKCFKRINPEILKGKTVIDARGIWG